MFTESGQFFTSSGSYEIDQSLNFVASSSAHLDRTFGSAGNRRTWSLSWWVKRASVGTRQMMFTVTAAGGAQGIIEFDAGDGGTGGANKLVFNNETSGTTALNWEVEVAFDSTSDWYHFVAIYDTTQASANDRLKCFANGTEQTAWDRNSTPGQNEEQAFNNALEHNIGISHIGHVSAFYNGLMAEIIFIDGVAKSATDFGESSSGSWIPVEYTGSFPGNSYHIDGRDSGDLGDDESGNGNDFSNSSVAQSSTTPTS